MSTTTNQTEAAPVRTVPEQRRLWPAAIGAAAVAAAATTALAAVLHAGGVSLDVSGEPIALSGFAVVTFMFAMVGFAIAGGLRRWTTRPRTAWLRTTVTLTALSFVPDLMADAATSTRLTLMATHLVAALIVIPVVAGRLQD